jgi:hypothetical protein
MTGKAFAHARTGIKKKKKKKLERRPGFVCVNGNWYPIVKRPGWRSGKRSKPKRSGRPSIWDTGGTPVNRQAARGMT